MNISRQQKEDAEQLKEDMIIECTAHCFWCKKQFAPSFLHMAHRISKAGRHIKKYRYEVIHHKFNIRITCSDCNSYVLLNPNTIEGEELIKRIELDIINNK